MNEISADRAAVLAKAARLVESGGLTVLDRDCQASGHRLDLVAVTSDGTIVAVEVQVAEPDAVRADAADITTGPMLEIVHAAASWAHERSARYDGIGVDIVVFGPDGQGEAPRGITGPAGSNGERLALGSQARIPGPVKALKHIRSWRLLHSPDPHRFLAPGRNATCWPAAGSGRLSRNHRRSRGASRRGHLAPSPDGLISVNHFPAADIAEPSPRFPCLLTRGASAPVRRS